MKVGVVNSALDSGVMSIHANVDVIKVQPQESDQSLHLNLIFLVGHPLSQISLETEGGLKMKFGCLSGKSFVSLCFKLKNSAISFKLF